MEENKSSKIHCNGQQVDQWSLMEEEESSKTHCYRGCYRFGHIACA